MITREQLETALDDNTKESFVTKNIDHDVVVISLLRSKIPYDNCKSIICGAGHEVVYLCGIEKVLPYLDEDDLKVLADCNVWIDTENDGLALFV